MGTILLFIMLLGSSSKADGETNCVVYEIGIRIIGEQGLEAGIAFFETQVKAEENLWALFGMGWSYWKEGSNEQARQICAFILERQPTGQLEANCQYLMGCLSFNQNEFENSKTYFQNAHHLYTMEQSQQGIGNTLIGMCKVAIAAGNIADADTYLQEIASFDKRDDYAAHLFELKSRVAFAKNDFKEALVMAKRARDVYAKRKQEIFSMYAHAMEGFLLVVNGKLHEAVPVLEEIDAYSRKTNDKRLSYYNGVSWVLLWRIQRYGHQPEVLPIRAYIDAFQDKHLERHLEFALEWNGFKDD